MFRGKYWIGLTVLLVVIVGVGLYLLATQPSKEPIKIYKVVEPLEKPTHQPQPEAPVVQETPQPQQDGHFHADGTWHAGPHETPSAAGGTPADVGPPARTSGLTYHAELLASNPVEALRAQAEERGHWSAQWIPAFSPDDTDAATLARNMYLIIYYQSMGNTTHPEYRKAMRYEWEWRRAFRKDFEAMVARREAMSPDWLLANIEDYQQYLAERARMNELRRLVWVHSSEKYAVGLIGK